MIVCQLQQTSYIDIGNSVINLQVTSGMRNEDPERGTRIRNEERESGMRNEIPYDLV